MPWNKMFHSSKLRWTLGAQELIFTNPFYRFFFGRGQVIPIRRGSGLQQPGVSIAIEKLNEGKWVHVFPEAKVNQSGSLIPFRWGVGKLVADSKETPIVLPIYHSGLEKLMPERRPHIPRLLQRNQLNIIIGEPLNFKEVLKQHKEKNTKDTHVHIDITQKIYSKMLELETSLKEWSKEWT